jgi:hypothetical protein
MECNENAMVLNIDDYHNIHTERAPSTTSISSAVHMATILVIPVRSRAPIPILHGGASIHSPRDLVLDVISNNCRTRDVRKRHRMVFSRTWSFSIWMIGLGDIVRDLVGRMTMGRIRLHVLGG